MKPLPTLLVVLLAGAAGAASGLLAARCSSCATTAGEATGLQADVKAQAVPQKPQAHEAELVAKVESLERALDALHQDVADLRSGSTRTAVVEPEKAAVDPDTASFVAQHRSAILAVIEQDRAEQARKAEEERQQRAQQQSQQRAERTAQAVGLNPAQTKQLVGFYEQQRVRMDDLRNGMQNGTSDPQTMRQTFQEFRTWSETELTNLFGADLSGKIMDEGGGMGMGRGGWGGGGPGGPGGQGANATGGGGGGNGRRNRGGGGQNSSGSGGSGGTPPTGGGGGG
jgi:ribosomal protein L19E